MYILWYIQNLKTFKTHVHFKNTLKFFKILKKGTIHFDYISSGKNLVT